MTEGLPGLPEDLLRILRDQSIVVRRDPSMFAIIGQFAADDLLREAAADCWGAEADLHANAYNAAVNWGSGRMGKKMGDLIDAINRHERARGRLKLEQLRVAGVIGSYVPCQPECCVRPGGLFHADGCENDSNSDTYRARQKRAREVLPGGSDGHAGWRAADVGLVGTGDYLGSRHWAKQS